MEGMDVLTSIGGVVGGVVVGAVAYVLGNTLLDSSKPLHVKVDQPSIEVLGMNILPAIGAVNKSLPSSMSASRNAKATAPKNEPIEDWYDLFGTDPYKITEILEGKIWTVNYSMMPTQGFSAEVKQGLKMMGMDFSNEKTAQRALQGAESYGEKALEQAKKDLERHKEVQEMVAAQGRTDETIKTLGPWAMNMVVVKLNSGDLMLYSPVQVRDETGFGKWLDSLGTVKWIVSGSSYHTLQLPNIVKRFPNAKYVSSKDAWMKLTSVKGIPKVKLDFEYTNPEDLMKLNNVLANEGVKFLYVKGDAGCNALVGIAYKTLLEVDLIYSHYDGGIWQLNREEFDKYEEDKYFQRLFKWGLCCSPASPNNALPNYRFWMMDPTNPFSTFAITPVKKDGSSCLDMAHSLRKVLSEDFDKAIGVHIDVMNREEFRKSIDLNWRWLDGKSLLEL